MRQKNQQAFHFFSGSTEKKQNEKRCEGERTKLIIIFIFKPRGMRSEMVAEEMLFISKSL